MGITSANTKCDYCGAGLYRKASRLAKNKNHFCSPEHAAKWFATSGPHGAQHPRYKKRITHCAHCKTELCVSHWRFQRSKHLFCNTQCKAQWTAVNLEGENNPLWKGGKVQYRGPNWLKQRRLVRKRDGGKCRVCGISNKKLGRAVDIHHIIPFREFGYIQGENENYRQANALSNLISLCRSCHANAENGNLVLQPLLL